MKKFFAMLLLVCMILSLAACGQQAAPAPAAEQPAAEEPAAEEVAPAEEAAPAEEPAAAEYKLGMGVSLNMNSSKAGNAQVDATVAAVVTDAEGKIVAVKLDVAQNKMDITDGQVETEKEFKTKLELGDDYNMVKFSDAVAEWYDQAAAFEAYVIGKTADEVAGTETVVNDEGHTVVTDETLYASCSISVGDFIEAIVKACNDDQAQTFTAGEITDTAFAGTKRELKEDYNMVKFSDATLEWYQQAQNFVDYAAGKTAEELRASETTLNEEGHQVFVDEALYASVSISVDGMINVVAKAADNAA